MSSCYRKFKSKGVGGNIQSRANKHTTHTGKRLPVLVCEGKRNVGYYLSTNPKMENPSPEMDHLPVGNIRQLIRNEREEERGKQQTDEFDCRTHTGN